MSPALDCPKCGAALPPELFNRPELAPCPRCDTLVRAEVFPAFFRPIAAGREAEISLNESEATCFYHPEKKAVVPCASCGRFLCALCDCELRGEHFCPTCVETGRKKGKIKGLDNQRVCYDNIALALSILPMIIFYLTFITAPMTLYVAIRYWRSPLSVVRKSRWRFVVAICVASLQIIIWALVLLGITRRWRA